MESGLDGRNNRKHPVMIYTPTAVSMESGLDGRNNPVLAELPDAYWVSQWSPA